MKKLIALATLFILAGCSAPPIKPTDPYLNNQNSSVVYFQRAKQFVNGGVDYRVFIGEEYIGELSNGGRFSRRISSGEKVILLKPYEFGGIPSIGAKEIKLLIESGHEYFVQLGFEVNNTILIGSALMVDKSMNIRVSKK